MVHFTLCKAEKKLDFQKFMVKLLLCMMTNNIVKTTKHLGDTGMCKLVHYCVLQLCSSTVIVKQPFSVPAPKMQLNKS